MASSTIIVGAGSAGGALAARLTQDSEHEVTLVEAGPDFARIEDVPPAVVDAYEMSVDGQDWGLEAYFLEPQDARAPQPYPRGRLVGGSSAVNAAIAQRAAVEDLDSWAAAGNDEWSFDQVLPYFRRLEHDLDFGEAPYHGVDGPIPVMRHQSDEWAASGRAFEQACVDRGFARCPDHNEPGATGVGPIPRNQIGPMRASSLVTYIAEARGRANFTLVPDARCTRVLFHGTRAVGIEIDRGGVREELHADRVVLSAGAIHTPHILMLSGIGPADVLGKFAIPVVVAREGVGQNFQDHPFAPVLALLREQTENVGVRAELKWTTAGADGLIDDMMMFPSVLDPATMNMSGVDTRGLKALTLVSLLAKPRSIGWLTLSSADSYVQPELHVNFLSDPSDIARLKESVRLAYDLATSSPLQEEIEEILFPDAETVADDERLEAYIHETASTSYHASCTCRMGAADDPGAVVSQRLAVHGTDGLYVADASVWPSVPTGLTNLTAFMTAERLAAWLRQPVASTV